MKNIYLVLWSCVSLIVVTLLVLSWYDTHHITSHKLSMIDRLIKQTEKVPKKLNVAIIGASLVAHGFSASKQTTKWLNQNNINISFNRITVLSASPAEMEILLINILKQNLDIVIVDMTPWFISPGKGLKFTQHRQWLRVLIEDSLNILPHKYNQNIMPNLNDVPTTHIKNSDKFKRFTNVRFSYSTDTINALKNTPSKVLFYLPQWAKEAYQAFGKKNKIQLEMNKQFFVNRYNLELLEPPPQLLLTDYTDLIHVNRNGRIKYMNWLKKQIEIRL